MIQERWYLYGDGWGRGTWVSRLAVAEEGLVVDPRLQALEVEPARGLGRRQPARRTGRRFALVLVRPVALVAVAALAFAIFRAGVAVGILCRKSGKLQSCLSLLESGEAPARAQDAKIVLSGVYCSKKRARIRTIIYL